MRKLAVLLLIITIIVGSGYWWLVRRTNFFVIKNDIPPNNQQAKKQVAKKVIAVGDISCEPDIVVDASHCQMQQVVNAIEKQKADNVLILGDLQYDKGQSENFQNVFTPLWKTLKPISYATPGNHEYYTKNAQGYFDYWNGNSQTSKSAGDRDKGYYSFNIGNWHIISLNSNCEFVGGCDKNSPQFKWLEQDLQNNKAVCALAMWHHPVFTSGKYKKDMESRNRGQYFWQALQNSGVELVLNGHDHLYERFEPQTAAGVPEKDKGISEFIVGTGGKSQYSFTDSQFLPNHASGFEDKPGFLELSLEQAGYGWRFVDVSGTVLDSGKARCHS